MYHPDVTAPGDEISSTCDTAGTAVGPCPPGENTTASGTSMASPHAAGAAAVLLQANPSLTPDQVRSALEVSAAPVTRADGTRAPFWEVGYGRIDLASAVSLVRDKSAMKNLPKTQSSKDSNVLRGIPFKVPTSGFWTWDAPRATLFGVTDTRTFTVNVPSTTAQLKVTLSHPSLAALGVNGTQYSVTVSDAAGKAIGTTTESFTAGAGTASLQVDLKAAKATPGTFSFAVSGDIAASDPDTLDSESALGRVVVLQVAQLQPR